MAEAASLSETAAALRAGQRDLREYVEQACDQLDARDPEIAAFVPESGRRERLRQQAAALAARYPEPASRPPLYGVLVGVKDIFRVDGLPTQAGTQVPAAELAGAEAASVRALREAGALVLGKTVTAEFAYFEPGPTRNPLNLAHTPGGSSSGSAAAVAAGFCPLALGTQTIGSVIRPAAYCGVVGFKPSFGRIATDGVIPVAAALDHVGLFTADVAGLELAAPLLCRDWRTLPAENGRLPRLGIPTGAYLEVASAEALVAFELAVARLEAAGYPLERVPLLANFRDIHQQTFRLMAAQMAANHADLFARYAPLYRPRTAAMIHTGQQVMAAEQASVLALQAETRAQVAAAQAAHGIDLWISPAATSAAPAGLQSTGDPAMNLPWTLIGFPTLTVPTRMRDLARLPYGLQIAGAFMDDERLLRWSGALAAQFRPQPV